MFVSENELNQSVKMLKDYAETGVIPNNDPEALWRAKKVTDAIIHPDSKEKIPLPLRGSTFVPMNVLIAAGMLTPGASVRISGDSCFLATFWLRISLSRCGRDLRSLPLASRSLFRCSGSG